MTEVWISIPGLAGSYEVSDYGRVRSLIRWRGESGRILKGGRVGKGYLCVTIGGRHRYIHRLVLEAFVGPCPVDSEACHNNGSKIDNRLENLRYDTPSNNNRDKVQHGTHHNSNKTHCPQGHEYTDENTYRRIDGGRRCRTCKSRRSRKSMQEKLSTAKGRADYATYVREWRRRTGRVDGLGNQWARRTHCNNGHEFTPANTYVRADGGRRCRTCRTS